MINRQHFMILQLIQTSYLANIQCMKVLKLQIKLLLQIVILQIYGSCLLVDVYGIIYLQFVFMLKQEEELQNLSEQSLKSNKIQLSCTSNHKPTATSNQYSQYLWILLFSVAVLFIYSMAAHQKLKKYQTMIFQQKIAMAQRNQKISSIQTIMNYTNQNINSTINSSEKQQFKFAVPKIVWFYNQVKVKEDEQLTKRSIQNINIYSKKSGFEMRMVDSTNFDKWLPQQSSKQLKQVIDQMTKISLQYNELRVKFENIRQTLIKLFLLRQLGGVVIKKPYIFTQTLNWLQNISNTIVLNGGNRQIVPKVFAFFSVKNSSLSQRQNIKAKYESQKYIIKFPALLDSFIAALPKTQFIQQMWTEFIKIVTTYDQIKVLNKNYKSVHGHFTIFDIDTAFSLSSLVVVERKQKQIDETTTLFDQKAYYSPLAIDHYGLLTMNSFYYPQKIKFYFTNRLNYFDNSFNYLSKMSQSQLEQSIGPLRYLVDPDPFQQYNSRIVSAINKGPYQILQNSFIHSHLYMNESLPFITEHKQIQNYTKSSLLWDGLPKILWLFWDKGFDQSSAIQQLCMLNMKRNAQKSGFKVNIVSQANALQFLPKDQFDKINRVFTDRAMKKSPQTKSDLYRLALLSNFGGIYLDSTYFFLQDFNWIVNIANQDRQRYFNRFGELPNVLMQFHPIEGGPFNWTVDQKTNTKTHWHLAYESNFIAAEKGSEYMKQWYDLLVYFLTSSYSQTEVKMKQCNIYDYKWTTSSNRYLSVMDSAKSVLGCRQKHIDQNREQYGQIIHANDYYKLWVMNGFDSIQKLRSYNNYDNPKHLLHADNNVFIYRYSQTYCEEVIGKFYKTMKFYGGNIPQLKSFLFEHLKDNFMLQVHPQSIFMKYLFNRTEQQIYQKDGDIHVKKRQ